MFIDFKKALAERFDTLAKSEIPLFYTEIDRDEIFAQYLGGFATDFDKQDHNCNCCKSFLRQYGGIIFVGADFRTHSI